jgi:biofilm PGA synthesis N-glycosyltransferase PgaC
MIADNLRDLLDSVGSLPVYHWALRFFVFYPVWSALVWVTTALFFYYRRERGHAAEKLDNDSHAYTPPVSILIRAGRMIGRTLAWATEIDYPDCEVVVIDDGASERTREIYMQFVRDGRVRLVTKDVDEGMASALNDALPCLRGAIVLVLEAGACPDRHILRRMVPHFRSARVAAVIGNARVANRVSFLSQLQVVENASIVSLVHRAQRVWGRVLTAPGAVTAYRKSALLDVGLYRPEMTAEDVEMTWRLQSAAFDVRYEPRAFAWTRAPADWGSAWRERRLRAQGLAQVLRAHAGVLATWRARRMWPIYVQAALSILWAYCFAGLAAYWMLAYALGVPPVGAWPLPNWWAMTLGTLCLSQLLTGVVLDARYDRRALHTLPMAIAYPILWLVQAFATALATPAGLLSADVRPSRS